MKWLDKILDRPVSTIGLIGLLGWCLLILAALAAYVPV